MPDGSPQKLYFDESGFTGNNLLHPHQTLFSYASIATDDNEAKEFVTYLRRKYKFQSSELKGKLLVKSHSGRMAIDEIFTRFRGRIKISISNKKYALACKFFEYIFEPCISENNSLFYGIGFHKFIATILYVEFSARGAGAEEIFLEFEELMRRRDYTRLEALFASSVHGDNSPVLTQIREFARAQRDSIETELQSLQGNGVGKWILDLTDTALFTLLANWGTEYEQITAICDRSKPLNNQQELFNAMIGRTDHHFSTAFGERQPITFNISGPIQFVDSKDVHGIQLADAIAAASVYAANESNEGHAVTWRGLLPKIAAYGSVIPDTDHVDLRRLEVQRNAIILMELHSRAVAGRSLLDGMPAYIQAVSQALTFNPIRIDA